MSFSCWSSLELWSGHQKQRTLFGFWKHTPNAVFLKSSFHHAFIHLVTDFQPQCTDAHIGDRRDHETSVRAHSVVALGAHFVKELLFKAAFYPKRLRINSASGLPNADLTVSVWTACMTLNTHKYTLSQCFAASVKWCVKWFIEWHAPHTCWFLINQLIGETMDRTVF